MGLGRGCHRFIFCARISHRVLSPYKTYLETVFQTLHVRQKKKEEKAKKNGLDGHRVHCSIRSVFIVLYFYRLGDVAIHPSENSRSRPDSTI